jgi:ribosomal protein S18 acetylase RimI-like enzyme
VLRRPEPGAKPPQKIVAEYQAVLRRKSSVIAWGISTADLPEPRGVIQRALIAIAAAESRAGARRMLRDAYGRLAVFVSDEDLRILERGKIALDGGDLADGGGVHIAAREVHARIQQETSRLTREFDDRIRAALCTVRRASDADAGAIARIEVSSRPADRHARPDMESEEALWQERLADPGRITIVATAGTDVIGFASHAMSPAGETTEVEFLCVREEDQRSGYGRVLCEEILAETASRGASELTVRVFEADHGSRRFLERLGFVRQDRGDDQPETPIRQITYSLEIPLQTADASPS